jgi:hypothetical protein
VEFNKGLTRFLVELVRALFYQAVYGLHFSLRAGIEHTTASIDTGN